MNVRTHLLSQFKACGVVLFIGLMLCIPCNATPELNNWSNDATNDTSLFPHTVYDGYINFSAESNETIVTWKWFIDSVDQSNNAAWLNESFGTAGHSNVTVYGTNANGTSDQITWKVYTARELESTSIADSEKVNESAFDDMLASLEPDTDNAIGEFIDSALKPYVDLIGAAFYFVIFGLSIAMQWTRQSSILMPTVLVLTISTMVFGLLPDEWKLYAALMVIIGGSSTLWILYKDRS